MKILLPITILLSIHSIELSAQNIVSGKVKDAQNNPVQSVTISLYKSVDTINIATTQTDKSGVYAFKNITKGSYVIKATSTGIKQAATAFEVSNKAVTIPDITIFAEAKKLQEVKVTAQANPLEMKEGKLVYNVEKSIAASGSTAFELLKRTPGVTVDQDENILLKGDANVNVMMDGKMTYLSAQQLGNFLKSTPAENLSRIEVIMVPSSQYDAAGNAGIINIVTKKSNRQGYALNLSAGAGGGRYGQTTESVIGNIRTKQFNFFGSYNYNYNHTSLRRTSYRTITTADKVISYDRQSFDPSIMSNHGYKAGADFYLNKNNELGFVFSGYSNHWKRDAKGPTYLEDGTGKIDSVAQNHNITVEPSISNSYNINYRMKLDTTGKQITADADYATYKNNSIGSLGNGLFNAAGAALQPYQELAFEQPTDITIRSIKADASLPFKKVEVKGGLKYSSVTSDNNFNYDSLMNGSYVHSSVLSNHFVYEEKIFAAYFSASKQFTKTFSIDAGARIENTVSEGNLISSKIDTKRNYTNLFPYLSLTKNINENNSLNLSVTRRINRPNYNYLNPSRYFFDKYSYHEGNAYLRPELSWNAALSYTFKQNYIVTIGYTRTSDPISDFAQQDAATGILKVSTKNFAHKDFFDALFVVPVKIASYWNMQNTVDVNYQSYVYQHGTEFFKPHKVNFDIGSINTFTLPANINFEAEAHYTSPSLNGIYILKYYFALDGGFKKSFLANKLDVKLSFTDLFKTDRYWGYSVYNATSVSYNHTPDSRRIKINFTYHFGGKLSVSKEHAVEEKERL